MIFYENYCQNKPPLQEKKVRFIVMVISRELSFGSIALSSAHLLLTHYLFARLKVKSKLSTQKKCAWCFYGGINSYYFRGLVVVRMIIIIIIVKMIFYLLRLIVARVWHMSSLLAASLVAKQHWFITITLVCLWHNQCKHTQTNRQKNTKIDLSS